MKLIPRSFWFLFTMSVLVLVDVSYAQTRVGPNVNIVSSDAFNQKQLEVEAVANPRIPNHIAAGFIHYQTILENPNRVTSKGKCGYSVSSNGGKTWKNYPLLPEVPNADKCGDPSVAWDTSGHLYIFGLTELTDGATTVMSIWRFTDSNNGTWNNQADFRRDFDFGTASGGQILDKGALIHQSDPTSTDPNAPGTIYACYSNFDGANNKKVLCSLSKNLGDTWSKPNQGKYNGTINSNNGVAAAPAPNGGIYLVWRAFSATENGYYFVKVSSNGSATTPVRVVGGPGFYPYDPPTLVDLARSNAFPAIASDGGQKIVLVFQANSDGNGAMAPSGSGGPRIFTVYSTDGGGIWSLPSVVDNGPNAFTFQFQPKVVHAGGIWSIIYYDARNDGALCLSEQEPQNPAGCGRALTPTPVIVDGVAQYFPRGRDRRFDLRVVQGSFSDTSNTNTLSFVSSKQVTQYEIRADTHQIKQRDPKCAPNCPAINQPFLSVGAGGNSAWMGDYIALFAKSNVLRNTPGSAPAWRNSQPGDPVTVGAVWADFRNVGFPVDASGIPKIDATVTINGQTVSGWTQFVPGAPPPGNACTNPKSRDVDLMFAEITNGGLLASVKARALRSGNPPEFNVNVQNLSGRDLFARLEIFDTVAENWSMVQPLTSPPTDDNTLDVKILNNSSVNKTIHYLGSNTPVSRVLVKVFEMSGRTGIGGLPIPGGSPVLNGLNTSAIYLPSTVSGGGTAHDLTLGNPDLTFGQRTHQSFSVKGQPSNQLIENQLIENQLIENQLIENQLIENQLIENQLIENQLIENGLIEDQQVLFTVTGGGNLTTASTAFSNVVNGQELLLDGWAFQLLIFQTQINPKVFQCTQLSIPTDTILSNLAITEPNQLIENQLIENYQVSNQLIENQLIENQLIENSPISDQLTNATFSVDSGEDVKIALRAFKPPDTLQQVRFAATFDAAVTSAVTVPQEFDPCPVPTGSQDPNNCVNIGQVVFGQAKKSNGTDVVATFDKTPPRVTLTLPPPDNTDGSYDGPITVGVSAKDVVSKVTSITCTDNGSPIQVKNVIGTGTHSATGSLSVGGKGTHNLLCNAADNAGNTGAASNSSNTATVTINTNRK